jgi:Flp pilus assembly protein TadG
MKIFDCVRRCEGSTSVEFAMVGPMFIGLMMAIFQGGMVLWTKLGMEHAVESAARCSAVNSSTCGSASAITIYAASQAYGLGLPASVFSFVQSSCSSSTPPSCCRNLPSATNMNMVSVSYTYSLFSNVFQKASIPLSAQACFPTS